MEEWQEKLLELIRKNQFKEVAKRAEEIANETGRYDEVARFLIGAGSGAGCRDGDSAIMLIEKAEEIARDATVKDLAKRAITVIKS
ncbi:MAG: hypothetical protein FGF52_03540 [Candidatus Brockarchaeota archaeon]|nr:hypothetical protein [Candidatus Brockarchaeota archaeon]